MTFSRRDMCLLVTALAASPGVAAQKAVLPSKAFPYDEMPVRKMGENESRAGAGGRTPQRQLPGNPPDSAGAWGNAHPPHHHLHEEMFLVREGTLEVTIRGQATRLGPGSVAFVGSNDEHGVRNPGTAPAEYFVAALGKDA